MHIDEEMADNLLAVRTRQHRAVFEVERVVQRPVCAFGNGYEAEGFVAVFFSFSFSSHDQVG